MATEQELVSTVEAGIDNLIKTFSSTPYLFYTESDLHCYLYNQLHSRLVRVGLGGTFETLDKKSSILLHKEYPTKERYSRKRLRIEPKGKRGHFDLCIWNPKLVGERLFHAGRTEEIRKEQKTFIAIEFNLVERNSSLEDAIDHMKWDRLKLSDYAAFEQTKDQERSRRNEVKIWLPPILCSRMDPQQ